MIGPLHLAVNCPFLIGGSCYIDLLYGVHSSCDWHRLHIALLGHIYDIATIVCDRTNIEYVGVWKHTKMLGYYYTDKCSTIAFNLIPD